MSAANAKGPVSAETDEERTRNGLAAALAAYLLWGIFPVYFKVVQDVPAIEVLAHRVVWAVPFGALIIAFRRQWQSLIPCLWSNATPVVKSTQ